jgi:hypothetical protein
MPAISLRRWREPREDIGENLGVARSGTDVKPIADVTTRTVTEHDNSDQYSHGADAALFAGLGKRLGSERSKPRDTPLDPPIPRMTAADPQAV